MNQLIFASLSHTHYWYEVGILKAPVKGREMLLSTHTFHACIYFSLLPRRYSVAV